MCLLEAKIVSSALTNYFKSGGLCVFSLLLMVRGSGGRSSVKPQKWLGCSSAMVTAPVCCCLSSRNTCSVSFHRGQGLILELFSLPVERKLGILPKKL